jgi:hypothetical protein
MVVVNQTTIRPWQRRSSNPYEVTDRLLHFNIGIACIIQSKAILLYLIIVNWLPKTIFYSYKKAWLTQNYFEKLKTCTWSLANYNLGGQVKRCAMLIMLPNCNVYVSYWVIIYSPETYYCIKGTQKPFYCFHQQKKNHLIHGICTW